MYWETDWVLPFESETEKSGAVLPTGGESAAKRAVEARQVRALRSSFVFIFLFNSNVRCDGFQFIQNDALREQLRKHNRSFARRVEHIQWDTRPSKLFQNFRDRGIGIRPIGFELDDPAALKCFANGVALENSRFVELASQTPRRGEIDEDGVALRKLTLQTLGRERSPVAREWCLTGSDLRGLELFAIK